MNPLGHLPASSSAQFRLSSIDWLKILRLLLVLAASFFITKAAPYLGHFNYVWNGTDYTTQVMGVVTALVELSRRYLAGSN